jgi:hypothetical protein
LRRERKGGGTVGIRLLDAKNALIPCLATITVTGTVGTYCAVNAPHADPVRVALHADSGLMYAAAGFFAEDWKLSRVGPIFSAGTVLTAASSGFLVHLILAFPVGRLGSRTQRAVVADADGSCRRQVICEERPRDDQHSSIVAGYPLRHETAGEDDGVRCRGGRCRNADTPDRLRRRRRQPERGRIAQRRRRLDRRAGRSDERYRNRWIDRRCRRVAEQRDRQGWWRWW